MDAESLIEGSEAAKQFLAESVANLHEFVLYPSEEFEEVEPVCLGSSGIDLQGETTTHGDLERIVESISAGLFWTTLYHDPTIHPVGRILTAKIFDARKKKVLPKARANKEQRRRTAIVCAQETKNKKGWEAEENRR
jgi:hypothetical protein